MFIPQVTPIQPITVVVQQAPGWPIWATTLLSAITGAFFGAVGSLVTEYVKPFIAKLRMKAMIGRHLTAEFVLNMNLVEAGMRFLRGADGKKTEQKREAVSWAEHVLLQFKRDRYDQYFETDKSLVYDLDVNNGLGNFYAAYARKVDYGTNEPQLETVLWLDKVRRMGESYIKDSKVAYAPKRHPLEDVFQDLDKAEQQGRRDAGGA